MTVFYACDPPNIAKARAMIERELTDMQTTEVTERELQQARTLLLHQIPLSEASVSGIGSRLLELSISDLPLDEPVLAAQR